MCRDAFICHVFAVIQSYVPVHIKIGSKGIARSDKSRLNESRHTQESAMSHRQQHWVVSWNRGGSEPGTEAVEPRFS